IDQMYSQPGLRLLAVEGVEPSNDTIAAQEYPLCNDFYAVIRANAAPDSPERRLYDWLSTDAGRACIEKAGYVPACSIEQESVPRLRHVRLSKSPIQPTCADGRDTYRESER